MTCVYLLCLLPSRTDHGESVSDVVLASGSRGSRGSRGGNRSFSSSSNVGSRVFLVVVLAIILRSTFTLSSSLVMSKS